MIPELCLINNGHEYPGWSPHALLDSPKSEVGSADKEFRAPPNLSISYNRDVSTVQAMIHGSCPVNKMDGRRPLQPMPAQIDQLYFPTRLLPP